MTHWSEDYRVIAGDAGLVLMHMPSQTVLLQTQSVSMETLNGLMREFDTFGKIRSNWRAWWKQRDAQPTGPVTLEDHVSERPK